MAAMLCQKYNSKKLRLRKRISLPGGREASPTAQRCICGQLKIGFTASVTVTGMLDGDSPFRIRSAVLAAFTPIKPGTRTKPPRPPGARNVSDATMIGRLAFSAIKPTAVAGG